MKYEFRKDSGYRLGTLGIVASVGVVSLAVLTYVTHGGYMASLFSKDKERLVDARDEKPKTSGLETYILNHKE